MLDDLRNTSGEIEIDDIDDDEDFLPIDFEEADDDEAHSNRSFLGMTAGERTLLIVFFFMNIVVFGILLLIATGRLGV